MIRRTKSLFSGKKIEKHRLLSIVKAEMALNINNTDTRERKELCESWKQTAAEENHGNWL